ncbi:MAG: ABC transporter ATP-binding protein [Candidatus Hatepunaea meridiana]|nr:ABC transporter ATP-binding protein [Candidatus Hatepunaea meridiana]
MRGGPGHGMGSDDSISGQAYDARLMKRLFKFFKGYYIHLGLAVVLLLSGTAFELAGPLLVKIGIDQHIAVGKLEGLGKVALIYLVLLTAGFILRYLQMYLMQWLGQRVVLDMRIKLFCHLQRMDVKFIDSKPIGWMMTRITNDVQTLNEMFSSGVVAIIGDLLSLMAIVVILLLLNVKLALVTFLVLPLLFWMVFTFRKKVRITFREIREALATLNGFMQEHISGVRTVQLFVRKKITLEKFQIRNIALQKLWIKAIKYFALFFPGIQISSAISMALILLVGGLMVRDDALTWGALVAFLQYAERFFRPIRDLSERYNTMQAAMAAAERVFWLFDTKPEVKDADQGFSRLDTPVRQTPHSRLETPVRQTPHSRLDTPVRQTPHSRLETPVRQTPHSRLDTPVRQSTSQTRMSNLPGESDKNVRSTRIEGITGKVEFNRVGFEYKPDEPVLSDISFDVEPGQTIAIVGATGAGKTTLISLLQRFWDVTSGAILLDDRNIKEYPLHDLRNMVGVVQQDVFLFSGSIAENVTLGDTAISEDDLREALRDANALEFVEALPDGIDEPVGERGARLSGGQKQLLAIARAIAIDSPILLLDEATSAVDTETERHIQEALERLMKGRTTLVVAHRLSTIRQADKIVVIHKGRLRESGTHEELLENDGIYARLYHLQFAEAVI